MPINIFLVSWCRKLRKEDEIYHYYHHHRAFFFKMKQMSKVHNIFLEVVAQIHACINFLSRNATASFIFFLSPRKTSDLTHLTFFPFQSASFIHMHRKWFSNIFFSPSFYRHHCQLLNIPTATTNIFCRAWKYKFWFFFDFVKMKIIKFSLGFFQPLQLYTALNVWVKPYMKREKLLKERLII